MNPFRERARLAIANPLLQRALDNNAERRNQARRRSFASLPDPEALCDRARHIRQETLDNLEEHLNLFTRRLESNGFQVHHAADVEEARRIVLRLARDHHATVIAKSKSMVSEEIRLNTLLADNGIQVVETDLGEFILQLRGEAPAHIITPAIHLLKEDVARTFEESLDQPYSEEVADITGAARDHLREVFLAASIGITGVNFGVAETGSLCLVTNEGNGRMVTTLPPVYVALMGLERLVPTLGDLDVMLQLISRSATGQKLTSYVSLLQGPRSEGVPDGPDVCHLVLIDNGRSALRSSDLAEALLCIRCGACLNACPVFREAGGHAYRSVYPGPIGSVISPGLFGLRAFGHLGKASTLCGACMEACPVGIDFPKLLLRVRSSYVESVPQPWWLRAGMRAYTWTAQSPKRFEAAQKAVALFFRLAPGRKGWARFLPPPLSRWTRNRHFPPFSTRPFRVRVRGQRWVVGTAPGRLVLQESTSPPRPPVPTPSDLVSQFQEAWEGLGGEFVHCTEVEVIERAALRLRELGVRKLLTWGGVDSRLVELLDRLTKEGFELLATAIPRADQAARLPALQRMSSAQVGVTGAAAGLVDTGTLIVPGGAQRPQSASLVPPIHLALLDSKNLYPSLGHWLEKEGRRWITRSHNVVLISGPSRTADIEMTLTTGVHGPRETILICFDPSPPPKT